MEKLFRVTKKNKEAGITLLEYCAGAAAVLSILVAGFLVAGEGINTLFERIGNWASTTGDFDQ